MAKEMDTLNSVYDEILGQGEPLKDEGGDEEGTQTEKDGAYGQEDYMDDAGDGTDPRDKDDDDTEADGDDDLFDDGAGTDEDDEEGGEEDAAGAGDKGEEEIPQRLVDAGRVANLSDEAIIELSESRPEALEALARAQEAQRSIGTQQKPVQKDASQQDSENKSSTGFKPLKLELTGEEEEEMGSKAVSMIKQLTDSVNQLGGKLEQQQNSLGQVEQRSVQDRVRQIDTHFDTVAEKVPELGKTVSLTDVQKRNRVFVVNTAQQAMQVYGVSDKEALTMGVNALSGQKQKALVKKELVRDLDKNRKRFSTRPRSRHKPEGKKSTKDRAMEQIDKILDSDEY